MTEPQQPILKIGSTVHVAGRGTMTVTKIAAEGVTLQKRKQAITVDLHQIARYVATEAK